LKILQQNNKKKKKKRCFDHKTWFKQGKSSIFDPN
jgi:hypothetical protein